MKSVPLWKSKAWMYRKYVVQHMTEQQIADVAGTTQATINNWLHRHNLKKNR